MSFLDRVVESAADFRLGSALDGRGRGDRGRFAGSAGMVVTSGETALAFAFERDVLPPLPAVFAVARASSNSFKPTFGALPESRLEPEPSRISPPPW